MIKLRDVGFSIKQLFKAFSILLEVQQNENKLAD